jgi:hypothetical protein
LTAKFGGEGAPDVPSARFHELIANGHIRFILTLNNVSTHHSFSPFCLNGGDYENSHATGIHFTVRGPHDALGTQAARGPNHGGTLVVDRDRVGPGLSVGGPTEPDRQGVPDSCPTLRISDIDRRATSSLVREDRRLLTKAVQQGRSERRGRGVRFTVR